MVGAKDFGEGVLRRGCRDAADGFLLALGILPMGRARAVARWCRSATADMGSGPHRRGFDGPENLFDGLAVVMGSGWCSFLMLRWRDGVLLPVRETSGEGRGDGSPGLREEG